MDQQPSELASIGSVKDLVLLSPGKLQSPHSTGVIFLKQSSISVPIQRPSSPHSSIREIYAGLAPSPDREYVNA